MLNDKKQTRVAFACSYSVGRVVLLELIDPRHHLAVKVIAEVRVVAARVPRVERVVPAST